MNNYLTCSFFTCMFYVFFSLISTVDISSSDLYNNYYIIKLPFLKFLA